MFWKEIPQTVYLIDWQKVLHKTLHVRVSNVAHAADVGD